MRLRLLNKGRLTGVGTLACVILSAALLAYTFFVTEIRWLGVASLILALVLLGIAGLSNSAASVGIPPPFEKDPLGWRKAKSTYEEPQSPNKPNEH